MVVYKVKDSHTYHLCFKDSLMSTGQCFSKKRPMISPFTLPFEILNKRAVRLWKMNGMFLMSGLGILWRLKWKFLKIGVDCLSVYKGIVMSRQNAGVRTTIWI
ncbi:uncharacterized protein LOC119979989 isoform X2 [Tripterygium wilfordii]|uniref:uncharacterized protein LOC119979989 isoform X2 n=1 Tax=Tripterygium wilfordii TaxID=458696 RepID=UPI0018F84F93|nr:uncharacterized protein LOC119979989 isoform X2 [Tripterygium wilfordii]